MRDRALERHRWLNYLQTLALLLAMFSVLGMAGWLFAGGLGVAGGRRLFAPGVSSTPARERRVVLSGAMRCWRRGPAT